MHTHYKGGSSSSTSTGRDEMLSVDQILNPVQHSLEEEQEVEDKRKTFRVNLGAPAEEWPAWMAAMAVVNGRTNPQHLVGNCYPRRNVTVQRAISVAVQDV